jgi:membrane-associated protease RseP (regulator of RpoE activity)
LPDTLTWETSALSPFNRAHWLVIDRFGAQKTDAKALADLNDMPMPPSADFGVRSSGMKVNKVMPGSNAEAIGLKAGDALLRLNDQRVAAAADVNDALSDTPPGSTIALLVVRDNEPVELTGVFRPQIVETPPKHLFARGGTPGRVDLTRAGNVITAATRGVAAFTLLVSPDQFDFGKPIKVVANGRTVFDGKVEKNVRTLLKYAASDNDRTMLFGAELHIKLD